MQKQKSTIIAAALLLLASASVHAQSLLGTWDGRWDYYPSECGAASCPGSDLYENLTFTSQTPMGGGFTLGGSIHECYPGPTCSSAVWSSATLIGNLLTIDFNPSKANGELGYDLVVDLNSAGNMLSGNAANGSLNGAYGWIPVGTGYAALEVTSGSCTANEANGYCNTYVATRVSAPEVQGSGAASALSVLFGALLVLRGKGPARRT